MKTGKIRRSAFVIALLGLSACSTAPVVMDEEAQSQFDQVLAEQLPRQDVCRVLATGFYVITTRALEDIEVRDLGFEGARGLATIDPEIRVLRDDGILEIYYGERFIKAVIEPLANDAESWADAIYEISEALWPYSVDLAATSPERLYEAVFDASLANLDIFSRYAGKRQAREHRDKREGFGGVDIELSKIGPRVFVDRVDPDSAAYQGGVRAGDMVIRVDDEAVIGKDLETVYKLLRGKMQSEVTLVVERIDTGVTQKLFLWRNLVLEDTVTAHYEDGILNLAIDGFNDKTARDIERSVEKHIVDFGARFQGIILDLRRNPGGLLRRAVQVSDLFIKGGRIISTQGRHPDSFETYDADSVDISNGRPIVVLLNGNSASAAEIVAAALQDRKRAIVVGSSSYGKGTVQSVQRLPNEGELTITWSRLLAPSGYAFHGLGVRPSICTSGVRDKGEDTPTALMETAGMGIMNSWRKVRVDDREGRKSLRQTCPPDRILKKTDVRVARNLLLDPGLYERFSGFTTIATIRD